MLSEYQAYIQSFKQSIEHKPKEEKNELVRLFIQNINEYFINLRKNKKDVEIQTEK